uniref:ETS domain-containing protein n=1 Tax=Macrostomum lignano TaxID=282301 RepID=A0A1I8HEH5_9PLAT
SVALFTRAELTPGPAEQSRTEAKNQLMETESAAAASEDLRRHRHNNHSRHSSDGEDNNNFNNNNNNHNNNSHPAEQALSSDEDGDFGSADEIGSEEASAWLARASRSLCEDSQAAAAGMDLSGAIGVGGAGSVTSTGGGVGIGVGADGSSPPLQGEVNVTLWQFLLELLMSRQYSHVIQWTNREGEFQLLRAEEVARLWGMRKNKNHRMNYDKLSRALRYYYQKNIIKKVQGQKFVYRFVGLSDSVLRAPRSLGTAAAAAAAASSIAT